MRGAMLILLLLFFQGVVFSQKYERKSVSYTGVLIVANPKIKLTEEQEKYVLEKFKEYVEMPRFDYNPLPEEILIEFRERINSAGDVSFEDVKNIAMETVVPKIIEILDVEKEIRAQNLLTEADRERFIATKAKTLGITAEQLEKIMNSAFIYIPFLTLFEKSTDATHTRVMLKAGLLWYRVVFQNNEYDLKLVVSSERTGIGVGKTSKEYTYEGKKVKGDEYAFRTAMVALARDIQVATRDIPEFRLGSQVREVYKDEITFDMGTREGVKLDDGFNIVEIREEVDGSLKLVDVGFARVTKVANNKMRRNVFSRARVIISKTRLEEGMFVSERPRLPFDLVLRLGNNPFKVKYSIFNWSTFETETKEESMMGYTIQADLVYNIGRNLDIPQLWVGAGIEIGGGDADNLEIMKSIFGEKPDVTILTIDVLLAKKFYFRRFAFVPEGRLLLETVNFSKDDNKLENQSLGFLLAGAVEYAATPDLNLGLKVGYRIFGESEDWTVNGVLLTKTGLKANSSGFVISLYGTYSLPRLGFDPLAVLKGVLPF